MEREAEVQALVTAVERLLAHVDHHIPSEIVHVEDMKKFIKELRDGSAQA